MREYISEITVSWAHCDAAGIVFYPHFYTWFDQSTERFFSANGLSYGELARDFGIDGMPLLETGAAYKRPCKLGSTLSIKSWVADWDRKTFLVKHRISHASTDEALEGFERRAMVVNDSSSSRGMRAIEIPEDIRKRFLD